MLEESDPNEESELELQRNPTDPDKGTVGGRYRVLDGDKASSDWKRKEAEGSQRYLPLGRLSSTSLELTQPLNGEHSKDSELESDLSDDVLGPDGCDEETKRVEDERRFSRRSEIEQRRRRMKTHPL